MFVIETGIPIPTHTPDRYAKYPFKRMKIGDSFRAPADLAERTRDAAKHWRARHPGWDYFYQMQKDGELRIWRTA